MKSEQEWEVELQDILEKLRNNSISEVDLSRYSRDFSTWGLDDNGIKVLASALKENHSLTTMYLYGNGIGAEGVRTLAEALKENHSLTAINLSENWTTIGVEGAKALAEALKVNRSLATIGLSNSAIGAAEGVRALAEALKENHSLTTMDLSLNDIGDKGAIALAEAFKENHSLTIMFLTTNAIGDKGIAALAEALKENHSLTEMDLSLNDIGDKGAIALAEALKENHSLISMFLNNNGFSSKGIGAEGAKALAEAFKENHSLTTINLRENNIGTEGAAALAEALKENYSLTTMSLQQTGINYEQKIIIERYLDRNIALREQLHQVVQVGDLKKTEEYIQLGAGLLSVTGEERNMPLHWASAKGHIDIVKLLIMKMAEQKLNLAIKNTDGKTPLDLAKEHKHKAIVTLLEDAKIVMPIIFRLKDANSISQAVNYYESILYLQPQNVSALVRKGLALQKLNQFEEAKQVYQKAIAIEDKNAEKYQLLAKQHLQKIEKKQALLQQATVAPVAQIANTNALIPNNTEREGLLERASSKNVIQKRNVLSGLAAKQTTISHVPSYSLSQSRARIQFNPPVLKQTEALKQSMRDLMPEVSEDIAQEETVTKRN